MKYRVSLKETRYGSVTVEADSPQEAKVMADEAYKDGNYEGIEATVKEYMEQYPPKKEKHKDFER